MNTYNDLMGMSKEDLVTRVLQLENDANTMRQDLFDLAAESDGVSGLHANGGIATWDEIMVGGRFEGWLMSFGSEEDMY